MENSQTGSKRLANSLPEQATDSKPSSILSRELKKKTLLFEDERSGRYHILRKSKFLKEFKASFDQGSQSFLQMKKRLGTSKKIRSFNFYPNFTDTPKMISVLKRTPTVNTYRLDLKENAAQKDASRKGLVTLSQNIKNLKFLRKFTFHPGRNFNVDATCFLIILTRLVYCGDLTTVKLDFPDQTCFPSKGIITVIFAILKKFKSLTTLSLHFNNITIPQGDYFPLMMKYLGQLNPLSKLSLCIGYFSPLTADDLTSLCEALSKHMKLSKLELQFSAFSCLNYLGIQQVCLALRNLKELSNVRLAFLRDIWKANPEINSPSPLYELLNIPNTAVARLQFHSKDCSLEIENLNSLKSLQITDLETWTGSGIDGLLPLSRALFNMNALQNFSFLASSQSTLRSFKDLSNAIKKMEHLRSLDLQLKTAKALEDKTLLSVSSAVSSLKRLSTLQLSFDCSSSITKKAIEAFSMMFHELTSLEKVQVEYFCQQFQFPTGAIKTMLAGIVGSKYLSHLSFNFDDMERLSASDIKFIAEKLHCLKYLQAISLKLCFPSEVQPLVAILHQARFLKEVNLDFWKSDEIDMSNVKIELPKVRTLYTYFHSRDYFQDYFDFS